MVRAHALAALENVPLWHERDISHSSVERVIGPDATIVIDFMLNRFTSLVDTLVIYPEQMERNLAITKGIFFSQADAYGMVQGIALRAWDEGADFKEIIGKDATIKKYLDEKEIVKCCDLKHYLKHVDEIYRRVFGRER